MKKSTLWLGLALALTAYTGRLAWRAHKDLVTLDVRDTDLPKVVSKLRWQTWEPIYVGKEVTGTVTLRVKNQPLEVVLNILNEQVNGRWTAVYPLYSSRKSLNTARALAKGELASPAKGWTNWSARPMRGSNGAPAGNAPVQFASLRSAEGNPGGVSGGPGGPGFGPGRELSSTATAKVSLQLERATAQETAQSIRRQSGARVVAEDGTSLPVTLTADDVSLDEAVAAVAKKVFRKWTRFYVFEAGRQGPPPGAQASQADGTAEPRPERPQLTDEQRQQMEQARAQMAADPARQEQAMNRMMSGILNSTPQQRAERDAQRLARQRARASR
jgi:hypothetical protein